MRKLLISFGIYISSYFQNAGTIEFGGCADYVDKGREIMTINQRTSIWGNRLDDRPAADRLRSPAR